MRMDKETSQLLWICSQIKGLFMIGFAHDLNKHLSLSTIYFHTENDSLKLDETLEKFRLEWIVS